MSRGLSLAVSLSLLIPLSSCTISRLYQGVPLRAHPHALVEGESTKADVLRLFGPPDQIANQTDGDAFVYMYDQQNFSSLTISEPIVTGLFLFNYRRGFDRRDKLVVLFDVAGTVRAVAFDTQTHDIPRL